MIRIGTIVTALRAHRGARHAALSGSEQDEGHALALAELTPQNQRIVARALPYSMTGVWRLDALVEAVRYCVRREIPGSFAECGVWRGGSVLAIILTLQELGIQDRDLYLYDTFSGMTAPTELDTSKLTRAALTTWREALERGETPWRETFGEQVYDETSVHRTLLATGYPAERIHMIKGAVEETLPGHAPAQIALLRLDTDWYESTRHELCHLYPRLSQGGVLVIDDYGHWDGARGAVDEYFASAAPPLLLNRIDYSGRIAIKH